MKKYLGIAIFILFFHLFASSQFRIDPAIVPVPSMIQGVKEPVISLKGIWKINIAPSENFWSDKVDPSGWQDVPVPAQADMQGIRLPSDKEYAYKVKVNIPADFTGKRIVIRFEGVTGIARAWMNGNFLKEHFGGFNVWTCDVTDYVKGDNNNWLTVGVKNAPADKATSRYDNGGIIRDIKLMAVPQDYLCRLNIETDFDKQYQNATLKVRLGADFNKNDRIQVRLALKDPHGKMISLQPAVTELTKSNRQIELKIPVTSPIKWDAEHPNLYTIEASVINGNNSIQTLRKKIGFRKIEVRDRKVFVNGNEIKLKGAGRFDSDPIWGRYLSDEEAIKEVKMLKEANLNFVRPSCYPATQAYFDACDSIGLYADDENSVTFVRSAQKDSASTINFINQLAEMIETDRSHPSIIIWELANETVYGFNISKTYEYAKAEDPTRPVLYSWSQSVPSGIKWPYDIFSYHYPDWDVDLGKSGVAVFNGRQSRPLPADMPVFHDEFAHGSAYYQEPLARDPDMRESWGKSLKMFWEKMFTTEGCLGGSMWAIIDDNAGGAWAYEWGAIDLWSRERPEYWHFKKAYSPIRVEDEPVNNPGTGKPLLIPVKNWYDHTNFNELIIQWTVAGRSGKIKGPVIRPHNEGIVQIPSRTWKNNEVVNLKFYDGYNRLIDEFSLPIGSEKIAFAGPQGPIPVLKQDDKEITVTGKDFELIFGKSDGLIEKGIYKGKEVIKGGPYFNIIGGELGTWKLRSLSATAGDKNVVLVTIAGAYDSTEVTFDITVDGTGLINTEYTLGRFRVPVPLPRKIPWNNQDAGGFEEVGIYYVLTGNVDKVSWKRHGLWSVYPADHIGRVEGTANRYGMGPQKIFGKKPMIPWSQDERDFSVFGQYDIGGRGTNDFRTMRENIFFASAVDDKDNVQVRVESDGSHAVRMEVKENKSAWIDNSNPSVKYTGAWEQAPDTMDFYGAKEMRSTKADDYVEYTFTGPGIAWIGSKGRSFGVADVYIDGMLETSNLNFLNRGGRAMPQAVVFSKEGLSNSSHTIKIVAKQGPQLQSDRQRINNNNTPRPVSIPVDAFKILDGKSDSDVKLIINNLWNHTKLGLGNYMKDPILIGSQYRNNVSFRLMDLK